MFKSYKVTVSSHTTPQIVVCTSGLPTTFTHKIQGATIGTPIPVTILVTPTAAVSVKCGGKTSATCVYTAVKGTVINLSVYATDVLYMMLASGTSSVAVYVMAGRQ